MRPLSILGVLVALHAGCSNSNKKPEPTVEHKDAAAPAMTLDEALAIMADPASKPDQGPGQIAMLRVEKWLERADEPTRARAAHGLGKVAAEGSTFMRTKAYELLGHFRLPGAQAILVAEVETPARDARERDHAGASLGLLLEDFDLIRTWLRDDQPYHLQAALEMMKTYEPFHSGNPALWAEGRQLLVALGQRPELPAAVVYDLAFFYEIYVTDGDPEVLALAKRWAKHPDEMAAGQMEKILP